MTPRRLALAGFGLLLVGIVLALASQGNELLADLSNYAVLLSFLLIFASAIWIVARTPARRRAMREQVAELEQTAANPARWTDEWGSGVGPVPGEEGAVIPADKLPPILLRQYGGSRERRDRIRAIDANALAQRGYSPRSETFVRANWSGTAWLAAVLLFIVLVGVLIFLYMIATKPDNGVLTVTYERIGHTPDLAQVPTNVRARLAEAQNLFSEGVITEAELAATRADILKNV